MSYLLSVPADVIREIIREESREEGFSRRGARLSLLLDVYHDTVKSQRAYARIWGWTWGQTRYRWAGIWHDVASWCTSNGRQLDHPLVANMPDEWRAWLYETYAERKKGNGAPLEKREKRSAQRPPTNSPTKDPVSDQKSPIEGREGDSTDQPVTYDHHSWCPKSVHNYISNPYPEEEERGTGARGNFPDPLFFLDREQGALWGKIMSLLREPSREAIRSVLEGTRIPEATVDHFFEQAVRRYGGGEGYARLAAAAVITREKSRAPNVKYLRTILTNFYQSHAEAEEAARQAGGIHTNGGKRTLSERASTGGPSRSAAGNVRRGAKSPGELSFRENLQRSGYTEGQIRAIFGGGDVFHTEESGDGAAGDALPGRSNGQAHD